MHTARRSDKVRKDVYAIVTEKIVAQLEAGVVPWQKPWTAGAGVDMPRNAVSKRTYRGVNVFMLALAQMEAGYEHSLWLTYKQAQEAGGQVRKGEQSELVVFWKRIMPKDGETDEAGNPRKPFMMLRYFNVFNIAQCDGLERLVPAKDETAPTFTPIDAAAELADAYFASGPSLRHGGGRAFYAPNIDHVQMPEPEAFATAEAYYGTKFHEAVHSTGHESRLNRPTLRDAGAFGDENYSKEELVAEMGAAMLCGLTGIEATVTNSAAYIGSWLKVLKGDSKLVVQAAAQAQRAADLIAGVTFEDSDNREVATAAA